MSAKTKFRHIASFCRQVLYLEIKYADIWLVYAYTVTYYTHAQPPTTNHVDIMEVWKDGSACAKEWPFSASVVYKSFQTVRPSEN